MRIRIILFFCIFLILLPVCCYAEQMPANDGIITGGWKWDYGVVNTFSGSIDISSVSEDEITISLSAEYDPAQDAADLTNPVFTVIDGKRITILRQSDTIKYMPDGNNQQLTFEGSLKMPEKGHPQRIELTVALIDPKGEEIKRITNTVERNDQSGARTSGVFYISFNINLLMIAFSVTALLVWGFVFYRYNAKKKKGQE